MPITKSSKFRRRKRKVSFKKKVLKAIRANKPEVKLYMPPTGALVSDATGDAVAIPFVAQGISELQRIGDKIKLLKFHYRLRLKASVVAAAFDQQNIRIMVVQDRDPVAGTTPAVNAILTGNTMYDVQSQASRRRFTIHHDRVCSVSKQSTEDRIEKFCTATVSLGGRIQQFTGAAANSQTNGNWYLVIYGDNPSAIAADHPESRGYLKLFYTDA